LIKKANLVLARNCYLLTNFEKNQLLSHYENVIKKGNTQMKNAVKLYYISLISESRKTPYNYYILRIIIIIGLSMGYASDTFCQLEYDKNEEAIELEPVVVTATAIPTSISNTTASVTVITEDQIEAQEAVSVLELLEQVPGLYVDTNGSFGGVSSVYIRGGDPNFTVVLIDGVKVNDPTNSRGGSFDFSTLGTDNIERIEIVRSPLSALYGSDALSGVINIITKKGIAQPIKSIELSGGRFGQFRILGQASGIKGISDYSLSASYLDDGESVEGSVFKSKSINSNLGLLFSKDLELRGTFHYTDIHNESFPEDSGGPEFAVIRDVNKINLDKFILGLNLQHKLLNWWEYILKFGLFNSEEELSSPGVAPGRRDPFGIPPNKSDSTFTRYEITLLNTFFIYDGISLVVGGQGQFEDGSSKGTIFFEETPIPTSFKLKRDIWSIFTELQFNIIPNLLVQGGVRIDFPEEFDNEVSPRIGLAYFISHTQSIIRFNWGEGFKLPSFFALGHPIVGSPDLLPETSKGIDFGITQFFLNKKLSINTTFFYNKFKNLIDFEEGPPPALVNRSEVVSKGFEIAMNLRLFEIIRINSHLNYNKTDIKSTDEQLRNRPEWWGGFSINIIPTNSFQVNLNAIFVGEVLDSSIPTGDETLDPWSRFDLSTTWKINRKLSAFLVIENLFNAEYEQFIGFSAPGISPRGGIKARF